VDRSAQLSYDRSAEVPYRTSIATPSLPRAFNLKEALAGIAAMGRTVREGCSREMELFIHMDPCVPVSCPIRILADRPQRRSPFVKRVAWTLDTVTADSKHTVGQN